MAVAFDALGPSSSGQQSATTSISWTHTAGGSGSVVLVWLAAGLTSGTTFGSFSGVTYGGAAMTLLKSQESGGSGGGAGGIYCYGITAAVGGANTVSATYSSATGLQQIIGFSASFTGAGSFNTTGIGTAFNSFATSGSVSATGTTSGGLVCAAVSDGSGAEAWTAGTQQWKLDVNTTSGAGNATGATLASTGGTATLTWTQTGDAYAAIAVEVLPAPPAPPPLNTRPGRTWRRRFAPAPPRQKPPLPYPLPPTFAPAGVATVAAAAPGAGLPFLTGTAGTGTAQYFTDQYGRPYMLRWDTVWNLIVNAGNSGGSTTWQSDMQGYCAARSAEGFNGFLTTPTANSNIPGAPFNNGNTWDGVAPFSSAGVLNNTFWNRVDLLLSTAAAYGMTVVLNCCYTYSVFATGSCLNGWTATNFQNYGAAVGARYAGTPNVIFEVGDDYGGSWDGGLNGFDTQFSSFLTGLRSGGANQLISVENMSEGSSRYSIDLATTYAWGVSNAQFDWIYSYDVAYTAIEDGYTEAANKSVASLPVVKMDGWYDNQYNGGTLTESVELFGRKWIWWSLSSGSRGAMYGQNELYQWPVNALSSGLAGPSPGSQYVQPAALNRAWNTFASLPGWHLLVPDTGSALVTAGRGTRSNGAFGTGAGTAGPTSMYLGGNTYVTASRTPDSGSGSSLAVIYIPAATTITIDQAKVVSGYTATWVDPANGATTVTTTGSTYNSTAQGTNSAGDHDWVLVLGPAVPAPSTTANAGVAAVSAVAPAATIAEAVTAEAAAVGAADPSATVAETVTAGVGVVLAADPGATVSTSSGTTANAGAAAVSVVANAPTAAEGVPAGPAAVLVVATQETAAVVVTAGVAAVAVTAPAATAAEGVTAGVSAVLVVAPAATAAEAVFAGVGVVLVADPGATVNTSGSTNAVAGPAAVAAIAAGPTPAIVVNAGVATVAAVGLAATASFGNTASAGAAAIAAAAAQAAVAVKVTAGVATILAVANPSIPPFQVGRSTGTTVTDPRDGTHTVTATATSAPGVT